MAKIVAQNCTTPSCPLFGANLDQIAEGALEAGRVSGRERERRDVVAWLRSEHERISARCSEILREDAAYDPAELERWIARGREVIRVLSALTDSEHVGWAVRK